MNYNMHGLEKTLTELHGMLNSAEQNIKKNRSDILMVKKGKGFKKHGNGKVGGNKKSKNLVKNSGKGKSVASSTSKEEKKYFHCNKTGHWKRNCKAYLEELKRRGMVMLPIQGLTRSRRMAKGEVDLRVGNGAKVAALAIGTFTLNLPTGLVLELDNCYHVPAISRNIISVSCLDKKRFHFIIKNNICSI
ncbi:unnamed protein product, partial [Cuscuta epithymum]